MCTLDLERGSRAGPTPAIRLCLSQSGEQAACLEKRQLAANSRMAAEPEYGLSRYQLMELMAQRRRDGVALLEEYGGLKCMAEHLKTDLKSGVKVGPGGLEPRRAVFGANFIPPPPSKAFISLCFDALQDKTLLLLIGAAIISIIIGLTVEENKV